MGTSPSTPDLRPAPDEALDAAFAPRPFGWLGADSSCSLRLDGSRHLWLWADTLWGRLTEGGTYRDWTAMPHNSLAIVCDSDAVPRPAFHVRMLPSGDPDCRGFFHPPVDGLFYWMVAGAPLSSGLVLGVAQVQGPRGLGDFRGTDVVVIEPTAADPQDWPYRTSRVPSSARTLSWNEGVHCEGGMAYFVGMRESGLLGGGTWGVGRTMHLARIPEEALVSFEWGAMTYWAGESAGGWVEDATRLATLFEGPYTEGTLVRHPRGFYYFVGCQAYQRDVVLYSADVLTGPWSARVLYTIPPLPDGYVAYAGKAHPELARDDEIVFTYNVNARDDQVRSDLSIYHPRFVRVQMLGDRSEGKPMEL